MRRAAILALGACLGSCGGGVAPGEARIEISYARVVDEGAFVRSLVVGRVSGIEGETNGGLGALRSIAWTVGVIPANRNVCPEARGWRMDLASGALVGGPETRDFRVRATSGVLPACEAPVRERVARCGERVTVIVGVEGYDETSATYETTFDCALAAFRP